MHFRTNGRQRRKPQYYERSTQSPSTRTRRALNVLHSGALQAAAFSAPMLPPEKQLRILRRRQKALNDVFDVGAGNWRSSRVLTKRKCECIFSSTTTGRPSFNAIDAIMRN